MSVPLKEKASLFTPDLILPDGADRTVSVNPYTQEAGPVRKGTVAATLNNIAVLNELFASEGPQNEAHVTEITKAVQMLLSSLRVIGVFDLFNITEWLGTDTQQGRLYVTALYLQRYPEEINEKIAGRLMELRGRNLAKQVQKAIDEALAKKV
jgi:hypothetical protein